MTGRFAPSVRDDSSKDGGFTVLEVVMAIAIVVIVMTSLAAFFVNSSNATDAQGQKQTAVQVATDAISQARSLKANASNGSSLSGLLVGRDATSTHAQWVAGTNSTDTTGTYPGVKPYLSNLNEADGASGTASLPTTASPITINGTVFKRSWFLGWCWLGSDGNCHQGQANTPTSWLQVVVDVQWNNKACTNSLCSYISATLVSTGDDPTFDGAQNATRPAITQPVNQTTGYNSGSVNLPITLTGGTAPYYWASSGLPPGLSLNSSASSASVTGRPTAAGTYNVVIGVTDGFGYNDSKTFTWTVNGPTLNTITSQSDVVGDTTASATATATSGGTAPYVWSQTGLPTGMSISGSGTTGTMSGTPTKTGTFAVTVTVTDKNGYTASKSFTWTITGPTMNTISSQTSTAGTADSATATVSGGVGPYTWNATNLPPGITTSGTGATVTMSGTPTRAGSYTVSVQASDSNGNTSTTKTFTWSVTVGIAVVTAPACVKTTTYACTATVSGIGVSSSYSWSNNGLFTQNTSGDQLTLTATKILAGTYTVTVTLTDGGKYGNTATLSFKAA